MVEPSLTTAQTGDPNRVYRTIAGRTVLFDGEGFIWDPSDWTEALAEVLAKESGLEVMGEPIGGYYGFSGSSTPTMGGPR